MLRHSYHAGIYGKAPSLQITDLITGDSVSFEGHRAFKLHTEIMSIPKGEARDSLVREIYDREKDHVSPAS